MLKMAAIVRLKRRRQDDAAESLIVSCKRTKSDGDTENPLTSVFKFAGTLPKELDAVTSTVREAIRKEKLQRSYKLHHYEASGQPEKRRQQRTAAAVKSRFSLVSSKRAVNLNALEKDLSTEDGGGTEKGKEAGKSNEAGESSAGGSDRLVWFCDAVPELLDKKQVAQLPVKDEVITCNDVAMVKEVKPMATQDDDYVFDIYYTNSAKVDFKTFENILAIESYSDETEFIYGNGSDDEDVYDDEDNEDDEGNWRNDYPDEDPDAYRPPCDQYSSGYGFQDELVTQMEEMLDLRGTGDGASSSDDENPTTQSDAWNPATNYRHYKAQLSALHPPDTTDD